MQVCTFPDRVWDWLKTTIEEIITQLPCHRKQYKLRDKRKNHNTGLKEVQDYFVVRRRSLAFYYWKVRGFTYSSLLKYKSTLFSLFEQAYFKKRYSITKINSKMVVSLSFAQNI